VRAYRSITENFATVSFYSKLTINESLISAKLTVGGVLIITSSS